MEEKDSVLKTNWIWWLLGILIIGILGLYFRFFNSEFSREVQDWASFGGYVSGLMLPILTGINIWVFIKLTKVIDSNNSERHKGELDFQKRKIITEIRQKEINALMVQLSNFGIGGSNKMEVINRVRSVRFYFETFYKSKESLFNCFDEGLKKSFSDIDSKFDEACRKSSHEINLEEILELANTIISKIQKYTVDNI